MCHHSYFCKCLEKNRICVFTESRRGLRKEAIHRASQSPRIFQDPRPSFDRSGPPDPGPRIQDNPIFIEDHQGVLPQLYNDDLSTIQFDDIFGGDSDEALDKFFTDVFSLPSYPPVGAIEEDAVQSPGPQHIHVLRRYRSDDDV